MSWLIKCIYFYWFLLTPSTQQLQIIFHRANISHICKLIWSHVGQQWTYLPICIRDLNKKNTQPSPKKVHHVWSRSSNNGWVSVKLLIITQVQDNWQTKDTNDHPKIWIINDQILFNKRKIWIVKYHASLKVKDELCT